MGHRTNVGFGKFLIMLLVTWLTFPGLANLLFLWPFPYYRSGAITALGISVTCSLVIIILAGIGLVGLGDIAVYIAFVIVFALKIWMTIDAISAFFD